MYLPRINPSPPPATDEANPTMTRLVIDDTRVHYDNSPYFGQDTPLSSAVQKLVDDVKASSFNHTLAVIMSPTRFRYRLTGAEIPFFPHRSTNLMIGLSN